MKWSLNLGRYAGIKVQIHWTFLILIVWVVAAGYMQGQEFSQTLWTIALVLSIFACVVLHEFGHALTARRFNIKTRDITLLPIGGLARLEKMPEDPRQELLIAIAGPLVNVAIAALIVFGIFVSGMAVLPETESVENLVINANNFLAILAGLNIFIFLFNLIPAFPMDGGRIFRALLAFKMDRLKATNIAARLGQLIAIGFAFIGLFYNPFLILIGIFVFLGAQFEAQMTQSKSILKGHAVMDVMMDKLPNLSAEDHLDVAVQKLLSGQETEFLVTDNGHVAGVISRNDIIKGLSENGKDIAIGKIMSNKFEELRPDMPIEDVFTKMQMHGYSILPVVDQNGKLIGSLDMNNITEFIMVRAALNQHEG